MSSQSLLLEIQAAIAAKFPAKALHLTPEAYEIVKPVTTPSSYSAKGGYINTPIIVDLQAGTIPCWRIEHVDHSRNRTIRAAVQPAN